MDLTQGPKKVYAGIIEPNNARTQQKRRLIQQKQAALQKTEQQKKKKRIEQQRKLKLNAKLRQDQKMKLLKQMQQEQRRRRQEENQSNTLSGKFGHMINDLNTNTTNCQFTISGMDLRPAQVKVLISNVQKNSSLKALTMCRKNLTDNEGREMAENLAANQFLERLELEGNGLGPQSLSNIAVLVKNNEALRLIDLQGNDLITQDEKVNYKGIEDLVQAMKVNETLLSLSLNNTNLDHVCSQKIRKMVQQNSTLIMLDIENNPDMNIDDVIAIQDVIMKNKQDYDDERYMEFIERKRMRREEDISGVLLLNQQTKKLRSQAIELNIKTKKAQLDEEWVQFLASQSVKKQKEIIRMEKEANTKKGKKKKR